MQESTHNGADEPTGPDGRPIDEHIAVILERHRETQVMELSTAAESLRTVLLTTARLVVEHQDDDRYIDSLASIVDALDRIESVRFDLETLPDYEEFVREEAPKLAAREVQS